MCLQGDRETFENYYRKQRKKQARLVLQPQANMVSAHRTQSPMYQDDEGTISSSISHHL